VIPLLDLKKQTESIRSEIDSAIKKVVDNCNFVSGKEIEDFEDKAAGYCRVNFALGVSNGTDALRLGLLASGVGPGDGVICPAFTYYATAGAVASIGARPVFADIDPRTYNISSDSVSRVLKNNRKVKAVIPVHLYGQCAEMDAITRLAAKHGLKVIEDVAQAFGAEFKGKRAGSIADCSGVSFFPGKNLGAFGDAGMLLTNDKKIYDKVKILRNQGNAERYFHTELGLNHRLDTLQAAVLSVKIRYLDSWNSARQKNAAYYNEKLNGLPLDTPFVPEYTTHIYHQYTLRSKAGNEKIIGHLRSKGIDSRVYYPLPLHLQKCFGYLRYKKGSFPEAEKASRQVFSIPVHPDLTREDLDYICASIKETF
jgi:dTDP-4-amino-4,6-dideoxygalactose transaminase